ncbi:MAG: ABC transporter permease [Firmicutes bacterium]|nr:ABC transporter permease [Bacillota bacterium]
MVKINTRKLVYTAFIFLVLGIIYAPIILLFVFSFSETPILDVNNFRPGTGLYDELFRNSDIREAVINTFVIAIVSGITATFIGTVACVGILAMRKRSRGFVMTLNQIPLINATIITSFSLVLLFTTLGMFNMGYIRLILSHTLLCLPVVALVVLPKLRSLDQNLFEAAQDLGARPLRALFTIIIPQLIPAMFIAFILGFTFSLDDFIITQYNNDGVRTISTLIYSARPVIPPVFRALSAMMFGFVVLMVIVINVAMWRQNKKRKKLKGGA